MVVVLVSHKFPLTGDIATPAGPWNCPGSVPVLPIERRIRPLWYILDLVTSKITDMYPLYRRYSTVKELPTRCKTAKSPFNSTFRIEHISGR